MRLGGRYLDTVDAPPQFDQHTVHESNMKDREASSKPSTGDEEVVNMCLINLLMALSLILKRESCVIPDRKAFHVKKLKIDQPLYEARVDGILTEPENQKSIKALIEAKRYVRSKNIRAVRMQEGAQTAALISSAQTLGKGTIWTISLGAHQASITKSAYTSEYVNFLNGYEPDETALLDRTEYGPFDLDGRSTMWQFLLYMAVIMEGEDYIRL